MLTTQGPGPEHSAPLHPVNVEPVAAPAVSVTFVKDRYSWSQSVPQSIPTGVEVTVPDPEPVRITSSRNDGCSVAAVCTIVLRRRGAPRLPW
jgi:heme/copper-type cytochrome/quinol oxidase subunit 2